MTNPVERVGLQAIARIAPLLPNLPNATEVYTADRFSDHAPLIIDYDYVF